VTPPKDILIVTHGFFPEQSPRSFRATELAKEFCRQGHKVTVVAPERQGMRTLLKDYPIELISMGKLSWKIPNLKSFGRVGQLYNKTVNRLLPLMLEYPGLELCFKVKKTLSELKDRKFDILISIAVPYPIHWGVAASWKSGGNNIANSWIADCGDPYCLQENDTFRPPFYFHWVEKWFMRKADFITVPTDTSYGGYFKEFHPKIRVIPQGFRFEDVEKKPVVQDGILRFGYGGAFIQGRRDPREFLAFLTSLSPEVRFEFHIYTKQRHLVEPFALKDNRIILHEPVSRTALLTMLSGFQFVVNFANRGTAQTPSKLIDYAIINKPILQIETGNLKEGDIQAFLQGDYSSSLPIDNPSRYRIHNVVSQFLELSHA
jgi:hypothetical protein